MVEAIQIRDSVLARVPNVPISFVEMAVETVMADPRATTVEAKVDLAVQESQKFQANFSAIFGSH